MYFSFVESRSCVVWMDDVILFVDLDLFVPPILSLHTKKLLPDDNMRKRENLTKTKDARRNP